MTNRPEAPTAEQQALLDQLPDTFEVRDEVWTVWNNMAGDRSLTLTRNVLTALFGAINRLSEACVEATQLVTATRENNPDAAARSILEIGKSAIEARNAVRAAITVTVTTDARLELAQALAASKQAETPQ